MAATLAVPNWSIHAPDLMTRLAPLAEGCRIHYIQSDPDHARLVTGISGPRETVEAALFRFADALLPDIDLREQHGVHPRVGALDVLPFLGEADPADFGRRFAERYGIPVHLYEASGGGRDLPSLRKKGVDPGPPDFGPAEPHPRWGRTVIGRRPYLLAVNIDAPASAMPAVREAARAIRHGREAGDSRFSGVRALAFPLESRNLVQLSLNLTQPDAASADDIVAWAKERFPVAGTELIGVCRPEDLPRLRQFPVDPAQVAPDPGKPGYTAPA